MTGRLPRTHIWLLGLLPGSTAGFGLAAPLPKELNFSDALLSAHLATAAYCGLEKHGGDDVLESWSCGAPCSGVHGMRVVQTFHGSGGWGADGYLGDMGDRCVLAFRGSSTFTDWLTDAASDYMVELSGLGIDCGDSEEPCMGGGGFTSAYLTVSDNVTAMLQDLGCKSKPLIVTGHSLGAAEAALAMLDLSNKGFTIDTAYTFGQPRVGNAALAARMKSITTYFRFTYGKDPVVHLPPRNLTMKPAHQKPAHWPVEVYYTQAADGTLDYAICTDDTEAECSNRYEQHTYPNIAFILRNQNDHLRYFSKEMGFPMDGDACAIQPKKHFPWAVAGTSFGLGAVTAAGTSALFMFLWLRKPAGRGVRFRADVEEGPSSLGASLAPVVSSEEKGKDRAGTSGSAASTRYPATSRAGTASSDYSEDSAMSRTGTQQTEP